MKLKKLCLIIIILAAFAACTATKFSSKWLHEKAPDTFATIFETSKGNFTVEVERKLSPEAVDRFYQLVKYRYFDGNLFYRVNPGFVAQFGTKDSLSSKFWSSKKVVDEPVIQGNAKGTLSFARGGPKTRSTDLFINLSDNHRLDTLLYNEVRGFPAFGKVTKGMEVLESLYSGYADTTMSKLSLMYSDEKAFLKEFPKLDTIHKAYLIQ